VNKESLIIEDSVEQPAISPPEQFEVLMNQVHETFSAHEFSDEVATDLKSYVEGVWSELHVSLDKDVSHLIKMGCVAIWKPPHFSINLQPSSRHWASCEQLL